MASSFEQSYPNIAHWVRLQGWIELGQDHYSSSLVRALDEGGMIWEGSAHYEAVDEPSTPWRALLLSGWNKTLEV